MILLSLVMAGTVTGLCVLIPLGFRSGDAPGEACLLEGQWTDSGELTVTMRNPGPVPVIVELSLRRPGLRLRLEGRAYAARPRSRRSAQPWARDETLVGVLEAHQIGTFALPVPPDLEHSAELVAVVGQQERLRVIHRWVGLRRRRTPSLQRPEGDRVAELPGGRDRVLPGASRVA